MKRLTAVLLPIMLLCACTAERAPAPATPDAEAAAIDDLIDVWDIALIFDPSKPASITSMEIAAIDNGGGVTGTFYGSPFESAQAVLHEGEVVFSAVTSDGTGPYAHAGRLQGDGTFKGQTLSTGRGFIMPWTATRRVGEVAEASRTVTMTAADGTAVYGETYFGELGPDAPIIALFHQAGGDGRGEYGPLINWFNENGFRVIAWDQRSGDGLFGGENRTAAAFEEDPGYCAAYPDMQAALNYTVKAADGAPVAAWGSSYSAGLSFRLAAENGDKLTAVVAASPAASGPMEPCKLDDYLDKVTVPVLALRPRNEMEATAGQAEMLKAAGVDFYVIENGVHGSSGLVDGRTEHDMSADRAFVAAWLRDKLISEE